MARYTETIQIQKGDPRILGVTKAEGGYNFAATFDTEEPVSLLLYKKGQIKPVQEIPLEKSEETGEVYCAFLEHFSGNRYEYNYRVGDKILQDVYAQRIVGREGFGDPSDWQQSHKVRCGFICRDYDWEDDCRPQTPYTESVLYKLHVRGYTKNSNSGVSSKGTFRALIHKIPYFQELGITAVELMPVYDFRELIFPEEFAGHPMGQEEMPPKVNFWGYAEGNYFAPKPTYCASADAVREVQDFVRELHQAGIECILEFYFPENMSVLYVLRVLWHWYLEYHVDGFHLTGPGVPAEVIMRDALLSRAKIFLESLGDGTGIPDTRRKYRNLAEYNNGFENDLRKLLKSDEDALGNAAMRIRRNPADYAVINYMTNQNGFTLMDLVSYDMKHNEANGEDNRDGTGYNCSWNCGAEGPSRKKSVNQLRNRQLRNAFLLLLFSQGVPLIYGGDEFLNSQQGNNNCYCQDNKIGWVDWRKSVRRQELLNFVKSAIAFRKNHPILHQSRELRLMDDQFLGCPDLSYHSSRAWYVSFDNTSRSIGMMYSGDYVTDNQGERAADLYVAYNFYWDEQELALPNLRAGLAWSLIGATTEPCIADPASDHEQVLTDQKIFKAPARSISILLSVDQTDKGQTLDRKSRTDMTNEKNTKGQQN